jgi:hypothetical protein
MLQSGSAMVLGSRNQRWFLRSESYMPMHDAFRLISYQFGDDYRPCRLTRHVVAVPKKNEMNDFQFAKSLDFKLFSTLQQYSVGKPILVFCATRKGMDPVLVRFIFSTDLL